MEGGGLEGQEGGSEERKVKFEGVLEEEVGLEGPLEMRRFKGRTWHSRALNGVSLGSKRTSQKRIRI